MAETRKLRLLVAEGNAARVRQHIESAIGATPGERYANILRLLAPDALVDIFAPADADATLPAPLDGYNGVVVTGSALHVYQREPAVLRQIEFAREVFLRGIPFFGSCWGVQLAAVAVGGDVAPNPRGRELAIARKLTLTDVGRSHPLHAGRKVTFDAPAIHGDEILTLPTHSAVTAMNAMSAVQAVEITHGSGIFWGTQYHPEFDIKDIAFTIRALNDALVEEGFFATLDDLRRYVQDIETLDANPDRRDVAWRFGFDSDILEPLERTREIANWIDYLQNHFV